MSIDQSVNIDAGATLQLHPQVAARTLDGHQVVVLADAGEVLVLNPTGTLVWQGVEAGFSVGEIARNLADAYGLDPASALPDVQALLTELIALHALWGLP
jgi:hypothetical protein